MLKEQLDVAKKLLSQTEIISLPKEVLELRHMLNTEEFPDPYEMEKIILQNSILAGEVVQAANMPSMQGDHPRSITTIKDAIDILGLRRLKNLVTAIALRLGVGQLGLKNLTKHSVKVSDVATVIAKETKVVSPDEAYLLGLFHNVGAFMLTKIHPDYEKIFEKSIAQPFSAKEMEIQQYGTTHGLVGVLVGEEWELENEFKKVMIMHDEENIGVIRNKKLKSLVAMVQLACCIVSEISYQTYFTPELQKMFDNAVTTLGVDNEQLNQFRQACQAPSMS